MAQSRRPDPVAPSESSGADATTVPPRPGRGLPVAVLVVAAALVLENLAAIAAGVLLGAAAPGTAPALELSVEPAIAALLLVTFHGIPLTRLGAALAGPRFLLALLAVNLLAVPLIVFFAMQKYLVRGLLAGSVKGG